MTLPRIKMLRPRLATLDTRSVQPPRKVANPFYKSPEWMALKAEIIAERGPFCQDPQCEKPGRRASRLIGDHIVELRDGGTPLDKANVLLRCDACHTRKTMDERTRRAAEPLSDKD